MKIRYFLFLFVFFYPAFVLAEDVRIKQIRQEYKAIRDNLSSYDEKEIYLDEYSAEGGDAKTWRDRAGNLRLLKVELFGESGKSFEEYYYSDNKLIFAFYQDHRYNVPFYVTAEAAKEMGGEAFDPAKTTITENRFYFHDSNMIRWLDENKKPVDPASGNFREREAAVFSFSKEILAKAALHKEEK